MSVIAVIGNRGRMGTMLSRLWAEAGHTLRGADREENVCLRQEPENSLLQAERASPHAPNAIAPVSLRAASDGADVVALCIPTPSIPAVLEHLCLHPAQILMDITSVKALPMRWMEQRHEGPVIGTHPLFGPGAGQEDLTVALTPGAHAEPAHIELVSSLFTCFGCRVFQTTPEAHDRGAAFVQGLNFISSAAYFASLAHREDVLPFLTPSFRRRLESSRKLLTDDAGMFEGFTLANPMTKDAMHTFRLFLDLVESGGLHDVVCRAKYWFSM
jgi:prephenate dehydrogenase